MCYRQFSVETTTLKFTKLECKSLDKSFADFNKCYLKAIRRDTVALNIHIRLFQVPVYNVSVSIYIHTYIITSDFLKTNNFCFSDR